MKIAITAESTVDLTEQLLSGYGIRTIPFTVMMGDRVGLDGEIKQDDIMEYLANNKDLPKTSAINEVQYTEFFEDVLKENDAIVHFSLSSELSSAYNNAVTASKGFKNVYVIDSRSLSTGIALLVLYARKLVDLGESPEEIVKKCSNRIPSVQASFCLKRVDCLYKGGRCSVLALLGANLLRIRPQILLKDGKMVAGKKYRGNYNHVVESYVNDILTEYNTPDYDTVFITYTTAPQEIVDKISERLKEVGFKNVYITRAGATISCHCGEDCLGVLYINDGK